MVPGHMPIARTERISLLANGASVPLATAAPYFALLRSHLDNPDAEWDVVFHLRETCLGRKLEPEQIRTLAAEGLLGRDGRPDPVLRAVVLSAVRGEGRALHLVSPFTDPVDRAIVEYLAAKDYLSTALEPAEARELFADDLPGALRAAAAAAAPVSERDQLVREIFKRLGLSDRNVAPPDDQHPGPP